MDSELHTINIEYCNNIVKSDISIKHQNLNIKYAINGTGKSTIAKAIRLASANKSLDGLRPFAHIAKNETTLKPTVSNLSFNNVMVFDNDYVRQYIFQKTDLLKNAFEIFIYSYEYDELKVKIDAELLNIKTIARDNQNFYRIREMLNGLCQIITLNKGGQTVSRKATGAKSLLDDGKGALFNPPLSLKMFKPFFDDPTSTDWAAWKLKGINSFCEKGLCPFCAETDNDEKKEQHKTFKESFDEKSIVFSQKLREHLLRIKEYINDKKLLNLMEMLTPGADRAILEMELAKLGGESLYLFNILEKLSTFNGYSIDQSKLNEIEKVFSEMKINESLLDFFNTEAFLQELRLLNTQIDSLIGAIGRLKGEIAKFKRYLQTQVKDKKQDINDFLASAGYNYVFDIIVDGDNNAHAVIRYKVDEEKSYDVTNPDQALSWGERNAFALILFMYDAISKNADLVILDDPISSFDSNKKYAIINRLFKTGKKPASLYKKTVLLLTHDFEPVIDYVQVGNNSEVIADYLFNEYGVVREISIKKNHDMYSMVVLLKELATDITNQLPVRIGCLRKYIEHTNKNPTENMAYHVLSSITHRREYPTSDKEGKIRLSLDEYENAVDEINFFIDNFDYNAVLDLLKPTNLLNMYINESNSFFRLLILRSYIEGDYESRNRLREQDEILRKFVDETFHIENDYLYMLDVRKFNIVPAFYIKKANHFVEDERQYLSEAHSKLIVFKWSEYLALPHDIGEVDLFDISASAGGGIELFDGVGSEKTTAINSSCSFAVRIKGNSMEPGIPEGSIAFVKDCEEIQNYHIGIVRINEKRYCKKVVKLLDRISLVSINEDYSPIYVTDEDEDFRILGEVIGIVLPKIK